MGAPALAAYAWLYSHGLSRLSREILVVAELAAGVASGILMGISLFVLDARVYGDIVAQNSALVLGLLPVVGGIGLGFSFNIQARRELEEPLTTHLLRAFAAFIFTSVVTIALIHMGRDRLFESTRYDQLNVIYEVARYSVWGVALSLVQRFLRATIKQ